MSGNKNQIDFQFVFERLPHQQQKQAEYGEDVHDQWIRRELEVSGVVAPGHDGEDDFHRDVGTGPEEGEDEEWQPGGAPGVEPGGEVLESAHDVVLMEDGGPALGEGELCPWILLAVFCRLNDWQDGMWMTLAS